MSNAFLEDIRNLQGEVGRQRAEAEAQKQAEEEAKEREREKRQLTTTKQLARWLGIDIEHAKIGGRYNNVVKVGQWEIQFDVGLKGDAANIRFREVRTTHEKDIKRYGPPRDIYEFRVGFLYVQPEPTEDDKALLDGLREFNVQSAAHYPCWNIKNGFSMDFRIEVPPGETPTTITEESRLEMAGKMLDTEAIQAQAAASLPEWRIQAQAAIEEAKRARAEWEAEQRAEEERRRKEREERERERAERLAQTQELPRYFYSGNTIGEVLEAIFRDLAAEFEYPCD